MIHEGPLLEYAGRDLALLQWAAAARHWIVLVLAAELFLPHSGGFAGAPGRARGRRSPLLCVALAVDRDGAGEDAHPARPGAARRWAAWSRSSGSDRWIAGAARERRAGRRASSLLGLGVIVVRRRSVAIALVAAQSLVLGVGALELAAGRSDEFLVAGLVLLAQGRRAAGAAARRSCAARASRDSSRRRRRRSCGSPARAPSRSPPPRSCRRSASATPQTEHDRRRARARRASRSSSRAARRSCSSSGSSSPRTASPCSPSSVPGGLSYVDRARRAVRPRARRHRRRRRSPSASTSSSAPATPSCCEGCVTDARRPCSSLARAGAAALAVRCSCCTPRARRRRPTASTSSPRSLDGRASRSLLAAIALAPRRRRAAARRPVPRRRRQRRVPRADRRRRAVQRARVARLPAHRRARLVQRRALAPLVLRRAVRLLGGAARRADRRQPRRSPGCWSRRRPPRRRCWSPSAAGATRSRPAGSTSCSRRSASRSRCWASSCWRSRCPAPATAAWARWTGTRWSAAPARLPHEATLVAFVLILAGLATKIGWAPVHNWLPDAHSEAPAPISALLSAALLPTVVLVAWRVKRDARRRRSAAATAGALFIGFGLASLARRGPVPVAAAAVEAPARLLQPRAHGRASRSASASAPRWRSPASSIHVAGHGLAKALGFYAAMPLLRSDPDAARPRARRRARRRARPTAAAMGVSLVALGGLPPSPLFVSELLILLGGIAGRRDRGRRGRRRRARARLPRPAARAARGRDRRARAAGAGARAAAASAPVAVTGRRARRRRCSRSPSPPSLLPGSAFVETLARRRAVSVDARRAPSRWREASSPRARRRRALRRRLGQRPRRRVAWRARSSRRTARRMCSPARRRTGACRRSSTSCPPRTGTSARPTTCTGCVFDGHEPLRALVAHPERPERVDDPGRRRRRARGRRRPDPRGRHRVRALPLPRRRRAHPRARPAPVLQAPRARAGGRGTQRSTRASRYAQRACAACAVTNTVAYAHAVEDALGLWPDRDLRVARTLAARARAPLQPPPRHRRDLRRRRLRARHDGLRRAQGPRAATQRAARRPPLPLRRRRRRRAARSRSTRRPPTPRRGTLRELRADAAAAWRELEFAGSLQARLDGVGVLDARRRAAPRRRRARRARRRRAHRRPQRRARACGTAASRPPRRAPRPATSPPGSSCAPPSWRPPATCSTSCSRDRSRPGTTARSAQPRRARRRPRREPARRDARRRRARRTTAIARLHLRTGSYANWPALAHAAAGQPPARLPAHQQELRALLRLRGPLMFVLLRQLARIRRQAALDRGRRRRSLALRHVDAGSCNGCEHELGARRQPRLRPRSASASTSSPRPATPTSCSSPAP